MSHYLDIINQTFAAIGKVPFSSLSVPYVKYESLTSCAGKIKQSSLDDVFECYGNETAAHAAFVAMLEKSTCPLVQAYKETVQACFVAQNLEELEMREGA
jgi:hypothetical protein